LIDNQKSSELMEAVIDYSLTLAAGGSASNTINGLTKLGLEAGFVGKIGNDDIGTFFTNDLINNGVEPHLLMSETASGRCIVFISPDGERSLCTYLGAACELKAEDLYLEMFQGYDIFHIEGYLVQNHELISTAVRLAKEAGLLVSIDLASYNVVAENLTFLHQIVMEYVDIVFANEEEAHAFTGMQPKDALMHISKHADIAIVKVGKEGSLVKAGNQILEIEARTSECIDTTGAGDLYAAGFLFGLASNYPLDICGKMGSLVSGKVVEVVGAKMTNEVWQEIFTEIKKILT
jgi:sugar/nucleoside kinase (ribokinase family)